MTKMKGFDKFHEVNQHVCCPENPKLLPTDLTAMMRWLANPHVSHNLNEHEQIITRLHQMQTTQYVLTFDRYLHPDKEKNLFIA